MSTGTSLHNAIQNVAPHLVSMLGARVLFNEPLKNHVAYRVGGPADILVFPKTEEELSRICHLCETYSLPLTVIGRGTNLLIKDEGIRGITLSLDHAFKTIEILPNSPAGATWVRVGGGTGKPDLLNWAIEQGLTGLEFSSGVPGTIGGGIYMNAGTKYGCYGDVIKELRIFDFKKGAETFSSGQFHFGYREQTAVKDSLVIWATFELKPKNSALIQHEVSRIIQERAEKQPLDFPSCGSTFKNPEGYSAGRLIEKSGLKGLTVGGAQIS
ncbi:MAG: UDP-N-acetylmuramate dehydrogenase, partial [Proteobacteria bacterium]|nr:UDP-N-acetylmuramate dehydrogenase [Pseudomonadota bacterium]